MQRRTFIKSTSLAAIAVTQLPQFLNQRDIIFGQNNKKYRLDTRWCQADVARNPVNDCHEMQQDRRGRIILLTNETKNNVLIFDKNGKLLEAWGDQFPGAHGLTLFDENGTEVLFITDYERHQVIKTTLDGRVLMTIDYPREVENYTAADQFAPTETAIAPNGDIFVADGYGKDFVIQFDARGKYIRHFGGRGTGEQHLQNAHGICLDPRDAAQPCLVVTSREQQAFKRFDLAGNYLSTIEMPGAWVCRPVIRGEFLYAAVLQSQNRLGQQSGFITILDAQNRVVSNLAGSEPNYRPDGKLSEMYQTVRAFQFPHDVLVDDEENLYVAQWNSGKKYPFKLTPVA